MAQHKAQTRCASPLLALLALAGALALALISAPRAAAAVEHVTVPGAVTTHTAVHGWDPDSCSADAFIVWDKLDGEVFNPDPEGSGPYFIIYLYRGGEPRTVGLTGHGEVPFDDAAGHGGPGGTHEIYPATEPGTHRFRLGGTEGTTESCEQRATELRDLHAGEVSVQVPVEVPDAVDGACAKATKRLAKAQTKLKKAKQAKRNAEGRKAKRKAKKKVRKAKAKQRKAKKAKKRKC